MRSDTGGAAEREGLWSDLESKLEGEHPPGQDLWAGLRDRIDLSRTRPRVIDKVEIKEQEFCSVKCYVIRNTLKDTYIRLDEKGFYLWKLMDGKHSLTDIIMGCMLKFGSPPINQLFDLLATLESNSFLVKNESDLYGLIYERTEAKSVAHRSARLFQRLSQGEISIDADGYFDWLYRNGGWIIFSAPSLAILAALSAVGSVMFLQQFLHAGDVLASYSGGAFLGVIGLFLLNYALAIFHEHGHGLAVKAFGRKVIKGGFLLYFGTPCFFVDTTDMWLGTKNQRIAVSWAGPFVTMIIASICSIAMALVPSSGFVPLLFMISVLGMFSMLMNLNPLLEWDGYYILMNYLEMPGLRARSLAFIKGELWQRLRAGRNSSISFSHEEKIFVVFGMMSALWSIIFISMVPSLWAHAIYPAFQIIWQEEGIGVKIILAAAGILILLSLASSIIVALRKGIKSIRLMHHGEER